ncbi:hypothetical protein GQ43DRAFT_162480 [Delitschia confertaspora ATCC 74209]|uniref:Uncharacterized protein n=1 Tax=Delitschia confertaspora ATCC 74209 TaxID=1513339 RepID=A0A9P4JRP0_9PLEO|nr:hypothetical protein GQ43DRAFT_162480 [Delitschia confertaspora ATCC 74209]
MHVIRASWAYAIRHCWGHFLPIAAIITLSYLNFSGFFVGAHLQGLYNDTAQAVDRLSLQVTAKLLELLIIASLSVVIMDIVRSYLLFASEGIPLGLLTARFRFVAILYLVSDDFRAGSMAFKSHRTRWAFILLIGTSALVAVLAGPSIALLLIPTWYEAWPAGGAKFWINWDLHPSTVDRSPTWGSRCSDSSAILDHLSSANSTVGSCIWAGYPFLAEAFWQRGSSNERVLSDSDGTFKRDITLD